MTDLTFDRDLKRGKEVENEILAIIKKNIQKHTLLRVSLSPLIYMYLKLIPQLKLKTMRKAIIQATSLLKLKCQSALHQVFQRPKQTGGSFVIKKSIFGLHLKAYGKLLTDQMLNQLHLLERATQQRKKHTLFAKV